MKRVIKRARPGEGNWVNKPEEAQTFATLVEAIETIVQEGFEDAEAVIDLGGERETRFPFRPDPPTRRKPLGGCS